MMTVRSCQGLLAAALLLATAGGVAAQEFRATIKGQVLDSSQAALPGATVTVQNAETNEMATATTNGQGNYTVPFLRPGLYTLTVEMSGFQKNLRSGLRLEVSQVAIINVNLAIGGVTETVTVASESPLLETSNANRGTVIDQARIAELPLQSRSPMALAVLVAGVTYNAQAIYLRPFDNGALAAFSFNGGQSSNNEFLLDGAPNNANVNGNNIAYVPPADSVQEFKMATNSYDAQYGRTAGGVVNMSIKSGTNSFHGIASEFYRRKWLDSNSFLINARPLAAGVTKAPKVDHYLDQYGFSIDGPLKIPGLYDGKNKTFFLFTGEKYREGTPAPQLSTTPTAAMRNGDFSQYVDVLGRQIVIYDPLTTDANGNRQPFPGNIIPANRIVPIAKTLLGYYPLPDGNTAGVAPWQSNLVYSEHFNKDVFWNWIGKVDHNISSNDRVFFRWGENARHEIRNTTAIRSGPSQNGQLPLIRANRALVGDWVHVLGAGAVFNVRTGYSYYDELSRSDLALGFDSTTLGFPASLVSQLPYKNFPIITMQDYVTLSRGSSDTVSRIWSIQPNVSLNRGKHNVRSGLDLRYTHVESFNLGTTGMQIDFTRAFTQASFNTANALQGSALASMLLGAPSGGTINNNVLPGFRWTFAAPWVQDDWRISNNLTVNLGFRWDLNGPVTEKNNKLNNIFDPTIVNPVSSRINQAALLSGTNVKGGLTFAGVDGRPEGPWKYDKNNFQLRAGGAYSLNQKTVLRAGYGRYYLNPTGQGQTQGFSRATSLIASNDGNRNPLYNLADPFPSGVLQPTGSTLGPLTSLGNNISYSSDNYTVPNVDQFSVGVQRELPAKISLEVSYVGSRTHGEQTSFGGINEPSLDLQNQCDVTKGGNAAFCNANLPNPFFGVAGFEGTTRFTSATLSRFELSRPFPQFGSITENERNNGKIWYDSLQIVANKRWAKGLTLSANYTWVPRWTEEAGYIDNATQQESLGPYFAQRKHRITGSGVYQLPGRDQKGLVGRLLGGWSIAPSFVFQSGQPWDLPGNVDLVGDASLKVQKTGQFIYGVKPCVGQRNATTGNYDLLAYSVAYGCTTPNFLIRENFQRRTTANRDDRYRRPHSVDLSVNFAKTTAITEKIRMQVRLEAFNLFNSAMYDERNYQQGTGSDDFGRINRNATSQSNFQRFVQLGFRLTF